MTKAELHDLATLGVTQRIRDIEQELASYHLRWAQLFFSPTPPKILKIAEANGHPARRRRRKARRRMSAAVRRKLSLAMKRRHANGTMARARRAAAKRKAATA